MVRKNRYLRRAAMALLAALSLAVPTARLPAATPPPLSVYGKLPGVEHIAISPSGDRIAIIGVVDETRRLVVLDQHRKPLLAMPLDNAKIRNVYWAGEDRVLLYKSDTTKLDIDFLGDKTELFSMIVVPLNDEKIWGVFMNNRRITGGVSGFHGIQERDGRYYGYFGGMTYSGDFRSSSGGYLTEGGPVLYEVDLQTQQAKTIAPRLEGRGFRDWVMGPSGKWRRRSTICPRPATGSSATVPDSGSAKVSIRSVASA